MTKPAEKIFRSYSQNLEDVLLWRAFRDLQNGFYIDVGAQDPVVDSVSRGFYEVGWRGVHFEPHPDFAKRIQQNRPDEIVREVAVSDEEGEMTFYLADGTGLSTGDAVWAEVSRRNGVALREITVPRKTLASLSPLFLDREIHWMKIDVEGMEWAVLKGWDSEALRPWVLLIEATVPGGETPNHHRWEPLVLKAGYEFACFDGLNRFYVSKEHRELLPKFRSPVNIFDVCAGCRLAASSPFALEINSHLEETRRNLRAAVRARRQMESSLSWRLTKPLRDVRGMVAGMFGLSRRVRPTNDSRDVAPPSAGKPEVRISLDPEREPDVYLSKSRPNPGALSFPSSDRRLEPSVLCSGFCVHEQLASPAFRYWLNRLNLPWSRHRKLWEVGFIAQALFERNCLRPGRRGLGFAVGEEKLPALFASMGCDVLATDIDPSDERSVAWAATSQHAADLSKLRQPTICPDEEFDQHVRFRSVDMNAIPEDLRGFDFTWSTCSFEHCGSIEKGMEFLENQIACLKPGGVAVHTTEFNLTSLDDTITEGPTVLFRRKDIEWIVKSLKAAGHHVEPISPFLGTHEVDKAIDVMPYSADRHLKLYLFDRYVSTSVALIITKGPHHALD